jgi:hypothetical protein
MKSGLGRVAACGVLLLGLLACGQAMAQGGGQGGAPGAASRREPARLQARIAALEARVNELAGGLRVIEPAPAPPTAARMERLALTMLDLQAALSTGRPFTREWRDLRAAYGDALPTSAAATLEAQAPRGLPAMADLRDGFGPVASQFLAGAIPADEPTGWLARLWRRGLAWAGGGTFGPSSLLPQLIARAERSLSVGQLEAAVIEVEAMEQRFGASVVSSAWLAQARMRLTAEAALQEVIRRAFEGRAAS